jgi:hypothetical protein
VGTGVQVARAAEEELGPDGGEAEAIIGIVRAPAGTSHVRAQERTPDMGSMMTGMPHESVRVTMLATRISFLVGESLVVVGAAGGARADAAREHPRVSRRGEVRGR